MRRRFWKHAGGVFALVQVFGLCCQLVWPHISQTYAAAFWGAGLIACFPGNIVGSAIVEKLLWNTRFSLTEMWAASVPLILLVNATIWSAVLGVIRSVLGRISERGA